MATGYQIFDGVSYSDAALEAAAISPTGYGMLDTYEFWHPVGTPTGPLYVVANPVPFVAKIEAGASRNAGSFVTFKASWASHDEPEESDKAERLEKQIILPNISGEVSAAIRSTRGSTIPWEVVQRRYASSEPGKPAFLPILPMYVLNSNVINRSATFTVGYGDPANVSIPAVKIRRIEYPTLSP